MRLGNSEIIKQMGSRIEPFDLGNVGPSSYDVTLGEGMKVFDRRMGNVYIDGSHPVHYVDLWQNEAGYYEIPPWGTALGTTAEKITLSNDIEAKFEGRSSLGRVFLLTHCTAAYCDPGFSGQITLEFANLTNCVMYLKPGDGIGQLVFGHVVGCTEGYGERNSSKYQGQIGTTGTRICNV